MKQNFFLFVLVFVGGMTTLVLEMCASRLLSVYFGNTQFIWACVIGLILIQLTAGYYLGGRLADLHPNTEKLCACTAAAAMCAMLIPFVGQGVLTWSAALISRNEASVVLSVLFLIAILLFALPVMLLGMISPFAVRLVTQEVGRSGRISGSLYAISTAGSILGAFLPVLWMIPTFGVRHSVLLLSAVLLLASLWGLRPRWRFSIVLPLLALLVPLGPLKDVPHLIYAQESHYNYIQVVQQENGTRLLLLNSGLGYQSIYYSDSEKVLTGSYWDYFLTVPYFNPDFKPEQLKRVAIVGLAGGTIAKQLTKVYGPVPIDGVEIDPVIADVGRKYFAMNEPNLQVYIQDGRTFMANSHEQYDLVVIDAYHQDSIPFQITTREFFAQIKARLSPTGVVALNTWYSRQNYGIMQAFINTMSAVYPSVATIENPSQRNVANAIVVATAQPTSVETFRSNLSQMPEDSVIGSVARQVIPLAKQGQANGGLIFTDDMAPIEQFFEQLLLSV